jgi:hypothetical protein
MPITFQRMKKTLDQQIAALQNKTARLMEKKRAADTGRKVIAGALLINEAIADKQIADWFVKKARERVTREADIKRLEPLLEQIERIHKKVSA